MPELFFADWMGHDLWIWFMFLGIVLGLMLFDLGVLNKNDHEIGVKESLLMSAFYILMGTLFSAVVFYVYYDQLPSGGYDPALMEPDNVKRAWIAVQLYFTGFLVEKTLALDNMFVISLIFAYFRIPRLYQHRVLFWGILGVIILRAIMIGFGAVLVHRFEWILYVFGAFLLYTGVKMLLAKDDGETDIGDNAVLRFIHKHLNVTRELHGNRFFVRQAHIRTGKMTRYVTPLFVTLIMIEIADLVFAVDSVPAVFAITQDPYIVYTSNIFAILGLRALYFALAAMMHRFKYLKYALAIVLIFIGGKIVATYFVGKIPTWISLVTTITIIGSGILYSIYKTRKEPLIIEPKV